MDMKYFAIQNWCETDLLTLTQIPTHYNISDSFTKALGRIKFHQQIDVLMGRRVPIDSPIFTPPKDKWIQPDTKQSQKRMENQVNHHYPSLFRV